LKAERVKVYAVGPDVKAPEFIPTNLPPIVAEKCKKKIDGKVALSLLVDATGRTRNLMFVHPLGNDLDRLALKIVATDRFTSATRNGMPVVAAESVEVNMQACLEENHGNAGNKTYELRLRSQPVRKYESLSRPIEEAVLTAGDTTKDSAGRSARTKPEDGLTFPVPLNHPDRDSVIEASKPGISGSCKITYIVDTQGMPQDVRVVRSLDPVFDERFIEFIHKSRFTPAMKNGEPIPVVGRDELSVTPPN
jgi:outer membrane biosynthesis protein TonB